MDKTIEELKAELEAYQRRGIEKAISEEKEKEAIRLTAEKAKEKELLELEFMKKHNIGVQSKTNTDGSQQATNLTGDTKGWEAFSQHFQKRAQAQGLDIKGRTYEDILLNIQNKRRL